MDFKDYFEADVVGMTCETSIYDFEEIYQAFKKRFLEELKSGDVLLPSKLEDKIPSCFGRLPARMAGINCDDDRCKLNKACLITYNNK